MCQLLETIKLENGKLFNLSYHNQRMNAARAEIFDTIEPIPLEDCIIIPNEFKTGLFRCRITYRHEIEKIEFIPQNIRQFKTLKMVLHDEIDYHLKYADRRLLNDLFAKRGEADEIIIIKDEMVTDCTIGNLVFWNGKRWVTPDTPLLKGTQRQSLLDKKLIFEQKISKYDLEKHTQIGIINAFFDLENMPIIKIKNIY